MVVIFLWFFVLQYGNLNNDNLFLWGFLCSGFSTRYSDRNYLHERILYRWVHQTKTDSIWRPRQDPTRMSDQDNATSDLHWEWGWILSPTIGVQMELGCWKTLSKTWLTSSTWTHCSYGPKGRSILWCHESPTALRRIENSGWQHSHLFFSTPILMINGTILIIIIVFLVYCYKCSEPAPDNYHPPSPVNLTFQATAPPSAVAPPSTPAQQVFVKYIT